MSKKKRQQVLEAHLAHWQVALRLQDWNISIREVPVSELSGCGNIGRVTWNLTNRTAHIKVLRPSHYSGMTPYDAEQTVCHELLHIHFAPFDAETGTHEATTQEQAINAIASALVNTRCSVEV